MYVCILICSILDLNARGHRFDFQSSLYVSLVFYTEFQRLNEIRRLFVNLAVIFQADFKRMVKICLHELQLLEKCVADSYLL